MKKRIVCFALVLVMLLGLLPIVALAAAPYYEKVGALEAGGEYVLGVREETTVRGGTLFVFTQDGTVEGSWSVKGGPGYLVATRSAMNCNSASVTAQASWTITMSDGAVQMQNNTSSKYYILFDGSAFAVNRTAGDPIALYDAEGNQLTALPESPFQAYICNADGTRFLSDAITADEAEKSIITDYVIADQLALEEFGLYGIHTRDVGNAGAWQFRDGKLYSGETGGLNAALDPANAPDAANYGGGKLQIGSGYLSVRDGALAIGTEDDAAAVQLWKKLDAPASKGTYLAITCDIHHKFRSDFAVDSESGEVIGTTESAERLDRWLTKASADFGGVSFDQLISCGDMGDANTAITGANYWDRVVVGMDTVANHEKVLGGGFFINGNHEWANGQYANLKDTNPVAKRVREAGYIEESDDYVIYSLSAAQTNNSFNAADITALDNYLQTAPNKPIFIASHYPLHNFNRTEQRRDDLINVLNKYADKLQIIFLWGHNHTEEDPNYGIVFDGRNIDDSGMDIPHIEFTYCAAGCMTDDEYDVHAVFTKPKGMIAYIAPDKTVSLTYYDVNYDVMSTTVLPKPGGALPNIDFTDPADASKFTVDNQTDSSIIEGEGFYMISTNEAIEDCKGQLSGDAANTPRDTIQVPVAGDWTATLYLKVDTSGSNGQYEFLCLYGMADYDNGCGIRAGNGSTVNFKEVDGVNESSIDGMKVQTGLTSGTDHWYRLEKEGTTYTGYLSEDGEEFQKVFTYEDTGIEASMIVIDAYSGRSTGYQYWLQSLTFEDDIPFMYPTYYLEVAVRTAAKIDKSKYTEESVKVLEDAVAAAESVIAKTTVDDFDQDEINNAEQAIYDAIDALVEKTDADKTELNLAIEPAERLNEADYTPETFAAVREALEAAKTVQAKEDATQEEVDKAARDLNDAVAALQPAQGMADKKALAQAQADAMVYQNHSADYTPESVAALNEACAASARIMEKEDATQEEVDAAVKAIYDAIDALEKKPDDDFLFEDVKDEGKFYFEPVYWAYEHTPQITKGTDDTHFGPENPCTRGHVVTFLWRAAGEPEPASTTTPFSDLKPGAFYEKAVAWAVEKGITKGLTDTTFGPDATCTRGQIVTFLWRFKNEPAPASTQTPFMDVNPNGYYMKAVAWAVENGITKGLSDTTFGPDATCTRGQVVTFLYRATNP